MQLERRPAVRGIRETRKMLVDPSLEKLAPYLLQVTSSMFSGPQTPFSRKEHVALVTKGKRAAMVIAILLKRDELKREKGEKDENLRDQLIALLKERQGETGTQTAVDMINRAIQALDLKIEKKLLTRRKI